MNRSGSVRAKDISEQPEESPVILINPLTAVLEFADPEERREFTPTPPLGILYIASALEHAGFSVKFYDLAVMPETRDDLLTYIAEVETPVVGMTVSTLAHNNAVRLAGAIKEQNPQTTVIMGGPHVTFRAEEVLSSGVVDYVVRREGEHTIVELLKTRHADVSRIQGISYCLKREYISTPDRPFIEDLDSIPFPARHLAPINLYMHPGIVITGRGCPYRCQFCVAGPLSGHRYRVRTPENVIKEVKEIHSTYRITKFYFADDTFTAIQERTRAICNLLEQLDFPITWICESRATAVTPELLEEMAHAGCIKIQFGVESGSDSILKTINKGITTDRVRKAVSWALDTGMNVKCSLIIGHPQDVPETVQQTIQMGRELTQLGASCAYALSTPLPGSELWNNAEQLGIKILTHNYDRYDLMSVVMETKHLNKHQLSSSMLEVRLPYSEEVDS